MSLLCGFFVIFLGVYLLNYSRNNPDGRESSGERLSSVADGGEVVQITSRSSEESQLEDQTRLMQSYGVGNDEYVLQKYVSEERQ